MMDASNTDSTTSGRATVRCGCATRSTIVHAGESNLALLTAIELTETAHARYKERPLPTTLMTEKRLPPITDQCSEPAPSCQR